MFSLSLKAADSNLLTAPKFLGPQSCASSGCHGGAAEGSRQHAVWSQYDFHHQRPVATLATARSERLADVLKIGKPAESSRCTACHAPMQTVPPEWLFKEVKVSDGVGCESCHGPAEHWLLAHTRKDYSHANRVQAGMRDLKNLYVRANTCVACHQNVESDLLRAGHPELIFELDGQAVTQPKHWRENAGWSGAQTWLVGQAVALREMSWQLSTEKNPHVEATNRWAGLNWVVEEAGKALEASLPGTGKNVSLLTSAATNMGPRSVQQWSEQLAKEVAALEWNDALTRQTLVRLAATAAAFEDKSASAGLHARRAERLVLALDRLVVALPAAKTVAVSATLDRLFAEAQSLPDFNPAIFAKHLRDFQTKITLTLEGK